MLGLGLGLGFSVTIRGLELEDKIIRIGVRAVVVVRVRERFWVRGARGRGQKRGADWHGHIAADLHR